MARNSSLRRSASASCSTWRRSSSSRRLRSVDVAERGQQGGPPFPLGFHDPQLGDSRGRRHGGRQPRQSRRRYRNAEDPPDEIIGGPAQERGRGRVGKRDDTVSEHDDHAVGVGLDDITEPSLARRGPIRRMLSGRSRGRRAASGSDAEASSRRHPGRHCCQGSVPPLALPRCRDGQADPIRCRRRCGTARPRAFRARRRCTRESSFS